MKTNCDRCDYQLRQLRLLSGFELRLRLRQNTLSPRKKFLSYLCRSAHRLRWREYLPPAAAVAGRSCRSSFPPRRAQK
jgi:hypothetical protein